MLTRLSKPNPLNLSDGPPHPGNTKGQLILAFMCLLLVEVIAFGINTKHVGVYMDEWISFHQLHLVPHHLPDLIANFNTDPRKILRPLECLNIPVLFYFVGIKPLWYHIASFACEFIGAWFLYLTLARFTKDRATSLAASVLFLLYPTHDTTHFAIVLWDQSLAFLFFAVSLYLMLKGLDERRGSLILWSAAGFGASLCEWEFALPLIVLYPCLSLIHLKLTQNTWLNLKRFFTFYTPYMVLAAIFMAYRSWCANALNTTFPMNHNLQHFLTVMSAGLKVSLSTDTLKFTCALLGKSLISGLSELSIAYLGIASACVFWTVYKQDSDDSCSGARSWALVLVGIVTVIFSYVIFGFSDMHMPVMTGWFDRVNTGGSLGASLIIVGLLGVVGRSINLKNQRLKRFAFAAIFAVLTPLLILCNWQTAKAWITSWQAQTAIIDAIKSHRSEIRTGDSLILGDIKRYVEGVVVIDLPIELENIMRTTLNNEKLYGTVVSERLEVSDDALVDRIGKCVMGRYPFAHMILYAPTAGQWIRISSRQDFIDAERKINWHIPESIDR